MFTQSCFIRKNTSELRKKLEELGYISHIFNNNETNNIYVDKLGTYISVNVENQPHYIDCETNEELFIALAALRDDSDYMQWFVCPKHIQRGYLVALDKLLEWMGTIKKLLVMNGIDMKIRIMH